VTSACAPLLRQEKMNAASLLPDLPSGARILVLRLRSIGDIVLLTPALHLLREWRPDLRVLVVIEARFRELLEGNPDIDEVLSPGGGKGWSRIRSRLHALREIRRRKVDLCINLHGGPTSRWLLRASGARCKVGFAHHRSGSIYDIRVPDARTILGQPTIHTAEHQASTFFYLGLPRQEIPRAQLFVGPERRAWWEEKRASLGIAPGQEYTMVHPTALYKTKEWAPEKFGQLGRYLEQETKLAPIYSCGPGEQVVLDAVQNASGSRIRRLEGVSLGQFAAALAGARLFVGNDSGPAHMAAALARPTVVIFGSSSSAIWGPWPREGVNPPRRIVQNPYDCNPCPGDRCYRFERPECILSVTFDQVRGAVEAVLRESKM
jgi:heptosyltransferase-3